MYLVRLKYTATDNNPKYKPGTIKTYFFGKGHKELTKTNWVELIPRKSEAVRSLKHYNQFIKAEEILNFWTVEVSIVECYPKGTQMKNTKNKVHTNKMNQRRIDNEKKKMVKDTLQLVLPSIYLILAEDHNFRDKELMDLNQKLYHSITLHQETLQRAAVNTEDIIEILLNKYKISPTVINGLLGGSK